MPASPFATQPLKPPLVPGLKDTLHNASGSFIHKLAAAFPKPLPVADSALVHELRRVAQVIQGASEPSHWDYIRDVSGIIIAAASVYVAIRLSLSQRKQQLKDTRLAWIRMFIIEPQSGFILQFFNDLETVLAKTTRSPLTPADRASIATEINTSFGALDKRFLSYTDSIDNSTVPKQLREIVETQQDDLADLIDKFDEADQAGSYKKLLARVTSGRNQFLAALYSFSFQ